MKTNKDVLEKELNVILSQNSANKKIRNILIDKFKAHGIMPGTVEDMFKRREILPIQTLSMSVLCLLTLYLYDANVDESYRIEPTKFFTDFEIDEAKKFKLVKEETSQYPVIFENVLKFDDDYFVTQISLKQLADLFARLVLSYNPDTQRPLISKEYGDKIIQEIDINKRSLQEIKENILQGKQITDFITFNILQNGAESFDYNLKSYELVINSGSINLIDGFHRCVAGLYAYQINNNIDFSYGLVVTHWDVDKSLRYIHQSDLKNKLKESFKRSINPSKVSNSIVKKINENSNSYLAGKITTDKHLIKPSHSLIMFDSLSEIIDLEFKPTETIEIVKYSKWLIDGLNYLIEQKPELLNETNELLWTSYVIILRELYGNSDWKNVLSQKIDIDKSKLDNISYASVNKSTVKKVRDLLSKEGVL